MITKLLIEPSYAQKKFLDFVQALEHEGYRLVSITVQDGPAVKRGEVFGVEVYEK